MPGSFVPIKRVKGMNIFIVNTSPSQAARELCDKHVVKMPLESAQLLCTTAHTLGIRAPYKPTHVNHPCAVWVRSSKDAFVWLIEHGLALCQEYTRRYNKIHSSQKVIEDAKVLKYLLPFATMPDFVQCMPEQYRHSDPVVAYRTYYRTKASFTTWRAPSKTPAWFMESVDPTR
jgi:hypothetical protein